MANVIKRRKRWVAVGCTHGIYQDNAAVNAFLKWVDEYKPDTRIFLGDGMDTACLRRGATGTPDEGVSLGEDGTAFFNLMDLYRPTLLMMGNHENRLWQCLDSQKEVVKFAAKCIIDRIKGCADKHEAELVTYGTIADGHSWRLIGGTAFGHGFMFNEQACRDHAEYLGRDVVFAHMHKVLQQKGRCINSPTGYCVGTLCDIPAMAYASTRRATAAWSMGWAWGEHTEDQCNVNLYELRRSSEQTTIPTAKCAMPGRR